MQHETRIRRARALAALWPLALPFSAQGGDPMPARDPVLRAAIERALGARDEQEQENALRDLRGRAGEHHAALLPQLFLFSKDARDTREAMAFGVLVERLSVPPADIARALVPLLESTDPEILRELANTLSALEDLALERGANFAVYADLLDEQERGRGYAGGLVRHLFAVDPHAAFLVFLHRERGEPEALRQRVWPLLLAEHVVEDTLWRQRYGFLEHDQVEPAALEQMGALARGSPWWARLYALRIALEHPGFLPALPLEALLQDAHPLVREAAADLVARRAPR